jgi:hypothetical protein
MLSSAIGPVARLCLALGCALFVACGATSDATRGGNGAGAAANAPLDDAAIELGLEHVRGAASRCVGNLREPVTWMVRLTITGDGHPSEIHVDSADLPDPMVSMCLETVFTRAVFPTFAGPPMSASHLFELR